MLAGEVKVVCNVEIVGIGVDWPEVSCIIYARPTMSDMRFCQNIGRGLRTAPGTDKTDLLILDHSTTTMRLGFVNEIYALHTELDDGKTKPTEQKPMLLPKECPACHYLKAPRVVKCPNCGFEQIAHAKPVAVERGTLREMKPGEDMQMLRDTLPDREYVWGQLVWWQREKGYNPYWVNMKFNEIYGVKFPHNLRWHDKVSAPCTELANYIYTSIKKWKGKQDYAQRKARDQYATGLCTEQDLEDFR